MTAWRDHFGLDKALDRGAGRGEFCQIIVSHISRRVIVGEGAHGDHVGHVPRNFDRHRIGASVARRRHHDDPRLPRAHHGLVEWVVPVEGLRFGAEREVEHSDVVGILVGHRPIYAADDVGVAATTVSAEGLDGNQVRVRGDAVVLSTLCAAGAEDDACDVRAVPVLVGDVPQLVEGGVVLCQHPLLAVGLFGQRLVGPQAAIQHRDGHTGAIQTYLVDDVRADFTTIVRIRHDSIFDLHIVEAQAAVII